MILKQSVGYNRQFLMVESADHITPLTGATVTVTLAKNTTAPAGASGAVTELGTGLYYIALTIVDTNTVGDLGFTCTAASGDPTTFIDQVQTQIFTDLSLNVSGFANISSNFKQNASANVFFPMTISGVPTPGLTVSGQRNFGSGFSPIAGIITDLGNGTYKAALTSADTNATSILYRFTAATADDRDIWIVTQP